MLNQSAALGKVFHALADPTRRMMVDRLSRGPASVGELAGPLPMSLAAVVQHLQVLEESGVIRTEKVGRVRTCRIGPAGLRVAEQWIAQHRTLWESRLDRLGEYLSEQEHDVKRIRKKKIRRRSVAVRRYRNHAKQKEQRHE
jgi:DNA-binding transcriptional ArsR family regulator